MRLLKYWQGILTIAVAVVTPFTMIESGDATFRGATIFALVAGFAAAKNWVDSSLQELKEKKKLKGAGS